MDEYLAKYSFLFDQFRDGIAADGKLSVQPSSSQVSRANTDVAAPHGIPSEFGEYLHLFDHNITDVDRILIAGYFVQATSEGAFFTTRDANDLLINQNVKVANASECVRRALGTRRVFSTGKGEYKVSSQGINYLRELQRKAEL